MSNALEKRKRTQEKLENSKEEPLPELVLNKGDKSKYVMAAVDYISAHYGDPELCVAQIAEHLGISEGHLIIHSKGRRITRWRHTLPECVCALP